MDSLTFDRRRRRIMTDEQTLKERAHGTVATLRSGKFGSESVPDELVARLGEHVGAELVETRGNTTTYHRNLS